MAGKNKNKGKKQLSNNAKDAKSKESEVSKTETKEQATSQEEELDLDPIAKAENYKQAQLKMLNNFIKDFQDDEKSLYEPLDTQTKEADLDKRRREEGKKIDKLCKKELHEVEEVYNDRAGGLNDEQRAKQLKDRIKKTLMEMTKMAKQANKITTTSQSSVSVSVLEKEVQANISKCSILKSLCNSILEKNYNLYLQHETMMQEEKKKRQELATEFNTKMEEIQGKINDQRDLRTTEIEENNAVRTKI
jgi:hypothetical protein